jgi:hypothetical protein
MLSKLGLDLAAVLLLADGAATGMKKGRHSEC